jgi:hypothetical protein
MSDELSVQKALVVLVVPQVV